MNRMPVAAAAATGLRGPAGDGAGRPPGTQPRRHLRQLPRHQRRRARGHEGAGRRQGRYADRHDQRLQERQPSRRRIMHQISKGYTDEQIKLDRRLLRCPAAQEVRSRAMSFEPTHRPLPPPPAGCRLRPLAAWRWPAAPGTAASGPSIGRVVVVGGGFGGSTAARYLKMWGGNVDVTLVERNPNFISCPISNLVIGGHKQMADITRGYDGLKALGVKVVQGDVTAIDAAAQEGAPGRRRRTGLRPADRVAGHRLHDRRHRRPGLGAGDRPDHARLEGRAADGGAAPPARGHARRWRLRDIHPQGALPLPAGALRARVHGGQLLQGRQAARPRCWCSTPTPRSRARRACSRRPSRTTTPASSSTAPTTS